MKPTVVFLLFGISLATAAIEPTADDGRKFSYSFFPIAMYDSDIGFGFGGKGIIKNLLHRNESLDLILFGSTEGEIWCVSTVSFPDPGLRHRTRYPLAVDLKLEYDRILKSNFFGFGNATRDNDKQFPMKFIKAELTAGHGFTEHLIAEIGLRYNHCRVYEYEGNPLMVPGVPGIDDHLTSYLTARFRWDTRDDNNHPRRGWNLGLSADFASRSLAGDYAFQRYRGEINHYLTLFNPGHILALRLWLQHIQGIAPYYEQSIIGGAATARGYKAQRFIDQAMSLASVEYRFIIFKRLGGVLFTDAGRVFPGLDDFDVSAWKLSYGGGLRYYVSGFVVRFDLGFSNEGMRIFFNFGHVF